MDGIEKKLGLGSTILLSNNELILLEDLFPLYRITSYSYWAASKDGKTIN